MTYAAAAMATLRMPESDTTVSPVTVAADCSMVSMTVMVGVNGQGEQERRQEGYAHGVVGGDPDPEG